MHRNPDQVLQSTMSNRAYHNSFFEAITVYTTFLQRIESDLFKYKHRTWGCIGLYDDDVFQSLSQLLVEDDRTTTTTTDDAKKQKNYPQWFNTMPSLLGFDSPTDWAKYMKSKHKKLLFSTASNDSNNITTGKNQQRNLKRIKTKAFLRQLKQYQKFDIYKVFVKQYQRTIKICNDNIVPIA